MQVTCPCCQGSGFVEDNPVEKLRAECLSRGFDVIQFPKGQAVSEASAEKLFNYGRDTLAAQARNGTNILNPMVRGNRRFYFLSEIIKHLQ